jgi:hypothetical protein
MVTNNELDLNKLEAEWETAFDMGKDEYPIDPATVLQLIELARRSTSGSDERTKTDFGEHARSCAENGTVPMKFSEFKASGSDGTAAAGAGRLPAFTPSEQQYMDWCERHDLPDHLSRDAFDDATSLYLTVTSGSELADVLGPQRWSKEAEMMESWLAQQAAAPADFVLVPKKITPEMIEAAMIAHYGKRRVAAVGGAGGIDMTVNDTNFSGVTAMRNFWRGALAAAPTAAAQSEQDAKRQDCGHGHVYPNANGLKARCGGPALCAFCASDLAAKTQGTAGQDGAA